MVSSDKGEDAQLFMEGLEGIDYVPTDVEVAIRAGRLRARYGTKLSTPDAVHLASAMMAGAEIFITNDHALLKLKLKDLKVHLLGEPLG
jgi:predicted nucleic acid-binding protein